MLLAELQPWLLFAQTEATPGNLSTFDPASPQAGWIRELGVLVLFVVGGIFLLVEGILLYCLYRFRRTRSTPSTEPPQVYGSIPIEIAWTVGPTLVVFLLILVVIRTELDVRPQFPNLDDPAPQDTQRLFVEVVGHQWWWEYRYLKYGNDTLDDVVTANELHIPAHGDGYSRPTYLSLQTVDVCHSFWVPRLGGKIDLLPNKVNCTWLDTGPPDWYLGQCAEFCGDQHANMLLRVKVDTPEEFGQWLDQQKQKQDKIDGLSEDAKKGREIFLREACSSCHRIRGTTRDQNLGTLFGPDLTHLASRKTIGSGILDNNPENLRQWITDPQRYKRGARMPAMNLEDRQIAQIAEYLHTLK